MHSYVNHEIVEASFKLNSHQFHVKKTNGSNYFFLLEQGLDWQSWFTRAFVKVNPRHYFINNLPNSNKPIFLGMSKKYDFWLEVPIMYGPYDSSSYFYLVDAVSGTREGGWSSLSILDGNIGALSEYLVALNLAKKMQDM